MANFQQLIFAAFLVFSFAACSKKSENVNADKIDAFYSLTYDENTNLTTSKASFGYRERTVKLTDGAYLRVDGFVPDYNGSQKAYMENYSYRKDSVSFEYLDNLDRRYTNSVVLEPIAFPLIFQLLSTNIDLPFYWVGEPLGVNETIELKVANQATPDSTVIFRASVPGTSLMYISSATLRAKINIGQGVATLTRTRKTPLEQGSPAGGLRTSVYIAKRNILIN